MLTVYIVYMGSINVNDLLAISLCVAT